MADIDPNGYVDPWCNSHSVLDNCTRDELDRAIARLTAIETRLTEAFHDGELVSRQLLNEVRAIARGEAGR